MGLGSTAKLGFAVCFNGLSEPDALPFKHDIIHPRADADYANAPNDTDSEPPVPIWLAGTPARTLFPTMPVFEDSQALKDAYRLGSAAPAHWAELQAFYSAGRAQNWFHLLGYPRRTDNQDPVRLELNVHVRSTFAFNIVQNNATATIDKIELGDFLMVGGRFVDAAGEGRIFMHEYHHHVLDAVRKLDAQFRIDPACTAAPKCASAALHEGLSDAHSAMFWNEPRSARLRDPDGSYDPCAEPRNYPDNPRQPFEPPGGVRTTVVLLDRYACNSVTYGYWLAGPDYSGDPSNPEVWPAGQPHRRGSILSGALWQFHRRLRAGDLSALAGAGWTLEASRRLERDQDDERDFLTHLIAILRAQTAFQKSYWKTALAKFEEKGVFPRPSGGSPDTTICDPSSCTTTAARAVATRVLSIDGPLSWNEPTTAAPPTFNLFVPLGSSYQHSGTLFDLRNQVYVELSTSPAFDSLIASEGFEASPFTVINKSPRGFNYYTPSAPAWAAAVTAARLTPGRQLFYRVRQCLSSNPTDCVVTSAGGAEDTQFVRISPNATTPGCSFGGAASSPAAMSTPALAHFAPLVLLTALLRRRARRWA